MKRFAYIDSLRGIAIILVLLAHTTLFGSNLYPAWFYNLTSVYLGPRGVQLFFVVSAFTLCLSYAHRQKTEKAVLKNYFIRRFFRIAPLFYMAVLYYLWQKGFWHGNPNQFTLQHIISVFSFTNGFSPEWINSIVLGGWSIAVEVSFYLVFPFLFKYLKSISLTLFITLSVAILVQICRLYLLSLPIAQNDANIQTFLFQFFPSQLPVFLIGITTYRLMVKEKFSRSDITALRIFSAICSVMLLSQFIFQIKIIAGHYLYAVIFSIGLNLLSKYPLKLIVNSALSNLGKISFSVYLSHFAVLYWLNQLGLIDFYLENPFINYGIRFFIVLVLSSAISVVTYHLIEEKGQQLGKKIIMKLSRNSSY